MCELDDRGWKGPTWVRVCTGYDIHPRKLIGWDLACDL